MDSELNHIGLLQLFYELKQIYAAVPDAVVTSCLRQVYTMHVLSPLLSLF